MTDSEQHRVLYALFCLSRDTAHISATTLGAAAGMTPTRTAAALIALERARLVDASRARLTLLGLATAVRLGSAAGGARHYLQPPSRATTPAAVTPGLAAGAPKAAAHCEAESRLQACSRGDWWPRHESPVERSSPCS